MHGRSFYFRRFNNQQHLLAFEFSENRMNRRDSLKLIAAGASAALLHSPAIARTESVSGKNQKTVESMFTPGGRALWTPPQSPRWLTTFA